MFYNLTARLGASRSKGGTRPGVNDEPRSRTLEANHDRTSIQPADTDGSSISIP